MEVGHIGLTDLIAGSKNCGQFCLWVSFPLNILKRLAPASRLYREMIMITTQVDLHQFPPWRPTLLPRHFLEWNAGAGDEDCWPMMDSSLFMIFIAAYDYQQLALVYWGSRQMNIFFDVPGSALPEQNSVEFTKNIEFLPGGAQWW